MAAGAVVTRDVRRARGRDGRARPRGAPGRRRGPARALALESRLTPPPAVPAAAPRVDRSTALRGVAALVARARWPCPSSGRVWRRGAAPLPPAADGARGGRVAVARGERVAAPDRRAISAREAALINLLGSFVARRSASRGVGDMDDPPPRRSARSATSSSAAATSTTSSPASCSRSSPARASIMTRATSELDPWLAMPFGAGRRARRSTSRRCCSSSTTSTGPRRASSPSRSR